MGTKNSSDLNRESAKNLAEEIGCYHQNINIDKIVSAFMETFTDEFKKKRLSLNLRVELILKTWLCKIFSREYVCYFFI